MYGHEYFIWGKKREREKGGGLGLKYKGEEREEERRGDGAKQVTAIGTHKNEEG